MVIQAEELALTFTLRDRLLAVKWVGRVIVHIPWLVCRRLRLPPWTLRLMIGRLDILRV